LFCYHRIWLLSVAKFFYMLIDMAKGIFVGIFVLLSLRIGT